MLRINPVTLFKEWASFEKNSYEPTMSLATAVVSKFVKRTVGIVAVVWLVAFLAIVKFVSGAKVPIPILPVVLRTINILFAMAPKLTLFPTPHPRASPANPAYIEADLFLYSTMTLLLCVLSTVSGIALADEVVTCSLVAGVLVPIPTTPPKGWKLKLPELPPLIVWKEYLPASYSLRT